MNRFDKEGQDWCFVRSSAILFEPDNFEGCSRALKQANYSRDHEFPSCQTEIKTELLHQDRLHLLHLEFPASNL